MERDEILEKIREITADRLGVDEGDVTPEASFREDLEADSLDLVELIMELEEQFGMEIPDEEAEKITTRSEEHTSELQSRQYLVCRLLLEKKKSIFLSIPLLLSLTFINYSTII